MRKVGQVAVVVVIVGVVYLLMSIFMPLVNEFSQGAVTEMEAGHDMTNYPGTSEAMGSSPWLLYFVPGIGGIIAIILILRRQDD